MRARVMTLASTIAVLSLLTGCGEDADSAPDTTPANGSAASSAPGSDDAMPTEATDDAASTATASASPEDDLPPFGSGTERQSTEPTGEWDLVFTDVRVAHHDGYSRIVLEFSGKGKPGWSAEYVDAPAQDGSGTAVDLDGDSYLDIYASGTTAPAPGYYGGPGMLEPADNAEDGPLEELYVGGTFEGYTQVIAGIDDAPAPFRIFALSSPARLVVDIQDSDND